MSPIRLASTAALLSALTLPAAAQQIRCAERSAVIEYLSSQFDEKPLAIGLANNGGVVEVLASKARGSWTLMITQPNGMSCMIAAGENWEVLPQTIGFRHGV